MALATRSARVWLAVGFVAATTLLAAALLRGLGQVDSFSDGWWWAVRHLLDPGALGDDRTWTQRLLGLALTLSGIVILIGVVLELLTEAVTRSLEYLDRAAIATEATDHVVFIGWSERLPGVIGALADASALDDDADWSRKAVVLVPPDAERDRDDVLARLRPHQGVLHVQVMVAGLDADGFGLANCRAARAIVILRDESRLADPVVPDLESVRRALLLSRNLDDGAGAARPLVVFEIARAANIDAAARLVPEDCAPFVDDRMQSAMLRDTLLEPAWSQAMERLLNPRKVPQIGVVSGLAYGGLSFGDLSGRLDGAVPVALVPARAPDEVQVAPPPDTVLADDDQLIVVMGREAPRLRRPVQLEAVELGEPLRGGDASYPVLLIGWNSKVPTYVEELALTRGTRFQVTSMSTVPEAERLADIAAAHGKAVELRCLAGDPMRRADLEAAVEAARPKAVVITSTPVWGSAAAPDVLRAADADALVTLMHIADLSRGDARLVILDMFDPSGAEAFDTAVALETLPSTSIFASAVTWMVIEPDADRWVSPLFAAASVRRGSTLFQPADGRPRPFAAVHRALLARGQAPIGLIAKDGLDLNPPAERPVHPGDRLLVIERLATARRKSRRAVASPATA